MRKILQACLALTVALVAAPALAADDSGLDLTLHFGADKYDAVGLKAGTTAVSDAGQLKDASNHVGVTALYRSGMTEFGVIGELGRPGKDGTTTLLGVLGGVGFDVGAFRLEALGELGAHKYGDVLKDANVVRQGSGDAWLVSVGLRPGLSMKFGPGDMLLAGIWAFARWDVTNQDVQVSLAGGGGDTTYKLGGSQFGAALRFGFRL
jgi:hypothetical protein